MEKRILETGRKHYINSEMLAPSWARRVPSLMGPPIMTIASSGYIKLNKKKKRMKKRKTHEGRNNVKRDNDIPVKILRHWKKEGGRNIVLPRKEILIRPDEMHRFLTR